MPEERLARPQLSVPRKLAYTAVIGSVALLALFAVGEVGLRLAGRKPLARERADIRVEPGGRLFQPDAVLGYKNIPGSFDITLGGEYKFHVTNLESTYRATHDGPTDPAKAQVWVLGDSITYGWSVNDEDTYVWRLQREFPSYEFVNFGLNGYGTIHSLLQIRQALAAGLKPAFVIVTYASFHGERNTLTRARRRALIPWEGLGALNQPYGRLDSRGELEILNGSAAFSELPLERYSALIAMISARYDSLEQRYSGSHEVSKAAIRAMSRDLGGRGIPLVVATVTSDPETEDMRRFCSTNGISSTDISVDYSARELNNLPYDGHPNAAAHKLYAERLATAIREALSR